MEPCPSKHYCDLVSEFTHSKFTVESDVFWAFAGIFKSLAVRFSGSYIWTTPYKSLDAAMLWYHDPECESSHTRHALHEVRHQGKIYKCSYPSWSWLSCNAQVLFVDPCGSHIVSDVIWKEPVEQGDSTHTLSLPDGCFKTIAGKTGIVREVDDDPAVELTLPSCPSTKTFDFGLLRLSAYSAILDIEILGIGTRAAEDSEREPFLNCDLRVGALVRAPSGEEIGHITTTLSMLKGARKSQAEFVQLSSNTETLEPSPETLMREPLDLNAINTWIYDGDCKEKRYPNRCGREPYHVKCCNHINSYNIMMIGRS